MRARLPALLLLIAVLSACSRGGDAMAPLLGITQPRSGAISEGQKVTVRGYAFDDSGVASVRVDGQEVLPREQAGKKLVQFGFLVEAKKGGQVELKVEAEDTGGQVRQLALPLTLDTQKPRLVLERVEMTEDKLLRIVGKATDDVEVDRVVVKYGKTYSRLPLPKGKEVSFMIQVPAKSATVIAVDAVGQRTEKLAKP
ncbi:hypothetical protein [Oceanithermus sp.]